MRVFLLPPYKNVKKRIIILDLTFLNYISIGFISVSVFS